MADKNDIIIIKKYANRRLYNTSTSSYVTLENLVELVREDKDFEVKDAKTGRDLTHSILTQIIVDEEAKGQSLLPTNFLKQLIRFYGQGMQQFVPGYLELSLESLTRQRERYQEQFGSSGFEAMQSQTRQNLAVFERSLSMFNPFTMPGFGGLAGSENDGDAVDVDDVADEEDKEDQADQADNKPATGGKKTKRKSASSKKKADVDQGDLSDIQAQLAAMQKKLDDMSKK